MQGSERYAEFGKIEQILTMWERYAEFGKEMHERFGPIGPMSEDMGPLWEDVAESGRRLQQKGQELVKVASRQAALERTIKSGAFFAWKCIAWGEGAWGNPHVRKKRKSAQECKSAGPFSLHALHMRQ